MKWFRWLLLLVPMAVGLEHLITGQVAGDSRSDWRKGTQLLAVYIILALVSFFAPAPTS